MGREPVSKHVEEHRIDLDCGIASRRIVSWLSKELALREEDGIWTYSAGSHACSVQVAPLEDRALGAVRIERTHLVAHGEAQAVEAFEKLFTLRFISAGG